MNPLARLAGKDFYDFVNLAAAWLARAKARVFYAAVLGGIGRGSWLKKPDQILGGVHIFLGDNVRVEKGAVFYAVRRYGNDTHSGQITVGRGTYINRNFNATSAIGISIGTEVAFGTNVFLCDFDHGYRDPEENRIDSPLRIKGPISIGDRCWIGSNSYIASGVELGHSCVVGANSVVTRSFAPLTVIAGAPAKAVRRYDDAMHAWVDVGDVDSDYKVAVCAGRTADNAP